MVGRGVPGSAPAAIRVYRCEICGREISGAAAPMCHWQEMFVVEDPLGERRRQIREARSRREAESDH